MGRVASGSPGLRRWHGEHLLRVKGILNLVGEAAPVAIHGVHHVFHPPVQLRAWPDADRRSRIVFITRDLGRAALGSCAKRCRRLRRGAEPYSRSSRTPRSTFTVPGSAA